MIGTKKTNSGFALPTILVTSVVMLIVLISAVAAASSVRSGMDDQYYNQLAHEASESGLAKAQGCLQLSASIPTWTNAKPLTPWTDCSGDPLVSTETCPEVAATYTKTACSVLAKNNIRTTFSIGAPSTSTGGVQIMTVTTKVQLIRSSNGLVWRTYNDTESASVGGNIAISYTAISNIQPTSAFGISALTTPAAQSFSFGSDGNVYGLGYNDYGTLGNGTTTNATKPVKFQLPGTLKARSVAVNAFSAGVSAFVITADDQVYGAGSNYYGQLGNGSTATRQTTPVKFQLPVGEKASSIFVHGESTFVITQSGSVYGAGANGSGQLGNGTTTGTSTPVKMILPAGEKVTSIQGDWHSIYLTTLSGKAYMTGISDWRQSGAGNNTPVTTPIRFTTGGDSGQPTVKQVATDGNTGWALLSDGTVWGVGRTSDGQIGNSSVTPGAGSWTPTLTQFDIGNENAVMMATDYAELVVVTDTGNVYGSGRNDSGDLGCGDTVQHNTPCQFILPTGKKAKSVVNTGNGATGSSDTFSDNTFVLTTDGSVYGAGDNNRGQLGIGTSSATPSSTPVKMVLPSGITATSVRAGAGTVVVLGSDGRVYSVGYNNFGQLGTGNTTNLSTPTATNYLNLQPVTYF
jgi:alpha-tubulin suppressor-like RCC1 family protein